MLLALALACSSPDPKEVGDTATDSAVDTEILTCPNGEVDPDCDDWTNAEGDCDDSDPYVNPSADEYCDGIDNDCDGSVDEGFETDIIQYVDLDGDGYGDPETAYDSGCEPDDMGITRGGDCDDSDSSVYPGAPETCDDVDDDCDGSVDEDLALTTWYTDADGDGAGDPNTAVEACAQPSGTVADASDCNDADPSVTACRSCQEVLDYGIGTTDGIYTLNPCGGSPSDYWCDMTSDGGGWTVAGWQAANATTTLGLSVRNAPGDADFSVDLACVPYSEIGVFNQTYALWETESYPGSVWAETAINLDIGDPGLAFAHGTYGPSDSLLTMGCVDYAYNGAIVTAYACDTDGGGGARGHLTDYAGEFCGPRLDYTWAWTDGVTCSYRGEPYTWGYAVRGYGASGNGN